MEEDVAGIIGMLIALAIIAFVIYCIVIMIGILISIAGIGGTIWGGGTAIVNYVKSFKDNMLDSNHMAA